MRGRSERATFSVAGVEGAATKRDEETTEPIENNELLVYEDVDIIYFDISSTHQILARSKLN